MLLNCQGCIFFLDNEQERGKHLVMQQLQSRLQPNTQKELDRPRHFNRWLHLRFGSKNLLKLPLFFKDLSQDIILKHFDRNRYLHIRPFYAIPGQSFKSHIRPPAAQIRVKKLILYILKGIDVFFMNFFASFISCLIKFN